MLDWASDMMVWFLIIKIINRSWSKSHNIQGRLKVVVGPRPGVANLFQIACQYFKFEKQKYWRAPCSLCFTTFAIIYNKNIFNVFWWLSKINATSAVLDYGILQKFHIWRIFCNSNCFWCLILWNSSMKTIRTIN